MGHTRKPRAMPFLYRRWTGFRHLREEVEGLLKRLFLWVFIVFATIYPPAELTMAILNQEFELRLHPEIPLYYFQLEMALYWGFYILAMLIILGILLVEAQIARQNNNQQFRENLDKR